MGSIEHHLGVIDVRVASYIEVVCQTLRSTQFRVHPGLNARDVARVAARRLQMRVHTRHGFCVIVGRRGATLAA